MKLSENSLDPSLDEVYSEIGFGKFHLFLIIILGFVIFFDAAEIILLSFLAPILSCDWKISMRESSLISLSIFVGALIGALMFGKLSDNFGRKPVMMIGICGIFYFGLLSAASPTIYWMILSRIIIGCFIGGAIVTLNTMLIEFSPVVNRGRMLFGIHVFWSLGSFYISLMTIGLVPTLGWRWWLTISILPMSVVFIFVLWIPESPRYLLAVNRKEDAIDIINKVAHINKAKPIETIRNISIEKSSMFNLFHPNYICIKFIVTYLWLVSGMDYYGFVITSPIVNSLPHKCLQNFSRMYDPTLYSKQYFDNSCCFELSWQTIRIVAISITGELINYVIGLIIINYVPRKLYIQILLSINSIVYFLMNLCLSPTNMGILLLFGRGTSVSLIGINYIFTMELYPTTMRGYALGFSAGFSRIGAMVSTLVIQTVMIETSYLGATLFYFSINVVAVLLIFFLPNETKDRSLKDSLEDNSE